jgi:hypothetical protein
VEARKTLAAAGHHHVIRSGASPPLVEVGSYLITIPNFTFSNVLVLGTTCLLCLF